VTIEEALKTAIEYEARVWTVYVDALKQATNKIGRRVFGILASEEQGHLKYLRNRLEEWEKTGSITVENLRTAIPSREAIDEEYKKLNAQMGDSPKGSEIAMLTSAVVRALCRNRRRSSGARSGRIGCGFGQRILV